jgi:hypothetical protein
VRPFAPTKAHCAPKIPSSTATKQAHCHLGVHHQLAITGTGSANHKPLSVAASITSGQHTNASHGRPTRAAVVTASVSGFPREITRSVPARDGSVRLEPWPEFSPFFLLRSARCALPLPQLCGKSPYPTLVCGIQRLNRYEIATSADSAGSFAYAIHPKHACLRCPLLRPDPKQQTRLIEIQENLKSRLIEAKKRGWLGEVEGLNLSLAGAEQKLASMASAPHSSRDGDATLKPHSAAEVSSSD